jgi:hypothetical protein
MLSGCRDWEEVEWMDLVDTLKLPESDFCKAWLAGAEVEAVRVRLL